MIYIGQNNDRVALVTQYMQKHGLKKAVVFGDYLELSSDLNIMHVPFNCIIKYAYYYKYLAFAHHDTVVIWNDCLRRTFQGALEYNCIRHCAKQTTHRLIFETMPIISSREDFMILYTMLEPSPFVKVKFSEVGNFSNVDKSGFVMPKIIVHSFTVTKPQLEKYQKVKADAIAAVNCDPNIIPRRCLKYAESLRKGMDSKASLLPRDMNISVSDLPVDAYYYEQLNHMMEELNYVTSKI